MKMKLPDSYKENSISNLRKLNILGPFPDMKKVASMQAMLADIFGPKLWTFLEKLPTLVVHTNQCPQFFILININPSLIQNIP